MHSLRLGDGLCAEIGRADRVSVRHDVCPAVLIAPDRERQSERENEPDDAEQRRLDGTDRLAVGLRVSPQGAADEHA